MLFVPKEARRAPKLVMNLAEVKTMFSVLEQRERLIVKLALLTGMRPGEIFGLTWDRLHRTHALKFGKGFTEAKWIRPKQPTQFGSCSFRMVCLLRSKVWRAVSIDMQPKAWVFASEKVTPLSPGQLLAKTDRT